MKRLIYAAKQHPIQNESVRKAFDFIWNSTNGDINDFYSALELGYGNSELPSSLDMEYTQLMKLAENYAKYKLSKSKNSNNNYYFDIKDIDRAVNKFVNSVTTMSVTVEYYKTIKIAKKSKIFNYRIFLNIDPTIGDHINIHAKPGAFYEISNEDKHYIEKCVYELKLRYELKEKFINKYYELIDKYYGECLGIPEAKYDKYIYPMWDDNADEGAISFTYNDIYNISKLLYNKGYIDNPDEIEAENYIKSLFKSYGLNIDTNIDMTIFHANKYV